MPPRGCAAQGINVTSLREIKLLREIKSPYVVDLLDVFPFKKKLTMVRSTPCCLAHACMYLHSWKPSNTAVMVGGPG